jgi:hypothetical protein
MKVSWPVVTSFVRDFLEILRSPRVKRLKPQYGDNHSSRNNGLAVSGTTRSDAAAGFPLIRVRPVSSFQTTFPRGRRAAAALFRTVSPLRLGAGAGEGAVSPDSAGRLLWNVGKVAPRRC